MRTTTGVHPTQLEKETMVKQVDSTQAGGGKTRGTIFPRIRNNLRMGVKTLVVVPGIDLQKDYAKAFGCFIQIINSKISSNSVVQQYAMSTAPIVCITSSAFTRIECFRKENVDLVIDEAINPFKEIKFNTHHQNKRVVDFSEFISLIDPSVEELVLAEAKLSKETQFYQIVFKGQQRVSSIDAKLWDTLSNVNFNHWITPKQYVNVMGLSDNDAPTDIFIFSELKPNLLDGWCSVWLAAAAFEHTGMCVWMQANNVEFDIVKPFKEHNVDVVFHIPQEKKNVGGQVIKDIFRWSGGYRKDNAGVTATFKAYCESNRNGRLLYNDNGDDVHFINANKINHNAHGLNQYSHITNYAYISSIQPSNQFAGFLTWRIGLVSLDKRERISMIFAGYTVYQLLLRTALRNKDNDLQVNAFFLDTEIVMGLMSMFSNPTVVFIDTVECNRVSPSLRKAISRTKRSNNNKPKKIPMTQQERDKKHRDKKKATKK